MDGISMGLLLSGWLAFLVCAGLWIRQMLKNSARLARLDTVELERRNLELENGQLRSELGTARERLAAMTAQKEAHENAQKELERTFKALAAETLQGQAETFLKLATERLDKKTLEAKGAFEEKTLIFQKLVEPIEKTLVQVQRDIGDFEKRRGEQFGQITEQLKNFSANSEIWHKEARSLAQALRRPEVRGSWGELQLRRVAELSGMSAHCDFEEQVTVKTEEGTLRPDMIVHLPNERLLVVDSKAVMSAYLDYCEAEDPEVKQEARVKHAANIRSRVRELSLKAYWDQFSNSPEFVILFIPNEAFLEAACEIDRTLIEDALKEKIIISTPTTLVALLKAVAYGWQQSELAANAEKVIDSAKELYDRLMPWLKHLDNVGSHLDEAMKSYNSAVGSLDSRVLPSARRLKDLGVNHEILEGPESVNTSRRSPRALSELGPHGDETQG